MVNEYEDRMHKLIQEIIALEERLSQAFEKKESLFTKKEILRKLEKITMELKDLQGKNNRAPNGA